MEKDSHLQDKNDTPEKTTGLPKEKL